MNVRLVVGRFWIRFRTVTCLGYLPFVFWKTFSSTAFTRTIIYRYFYFYHLSLRYIPIFKLSIITFNKNSYYAFVCLFTVLLQANVNCTHQTLSYDNLRWRKLLQNCYVTLLALYIGIILAIYIIYYYIHTYTEKKRKRRQ